MSSRRNIRSHYLLAVAFASTLCGVRTVSAGSIEIDSRLKPTTLSLGEYTELTVSVQWDGAADRYLFGWPEEPALDGLRVVGSKRSARSWADGGTEWSRQEFTWTLEPEYVGNGRIGVAEVTYWAANDTARDGRRLTTYPFDVPITAGDNASNVYWWAIGFMVSAGAAALVFWSVGRHRAVGVQQRRSPMGDVATSVRTRLDNLRLARQRGDGRAFAGMASAFLDELAQIRQKDSSGSTHSSEVSDSQDELNVVECEQEVMTELIDELRRQRYAPGGTDPASMGMIESVLRLLALRLIEGGNDNH